MDWSLVLPELIVAGAGIGVLLLDLFLAPEKRRLTGYASLAGLAAAMVASLWLAVAKVDWSLTAGADGSPVAAGFTALGGMIAVDAFSVLLKLLFLAIGLVVVLLGVDFAEKRKLPVGEFFALLLFAVLGMMLMAGSRDLILIYLGLETTAISSYALAGLLKDDLKSGEAALKYFLTGALASALILFGMALVFGGTGSTNVTALLGAGVTTGQLGGAGNPIALTGLVLLVAGFGFKLAAVPFHFWAPDAYEGAPTPVTAFFSVGPKAAAFAVVLRIFGPVLALGGSAGGAGAGGLAGAGVLGVLFAVLAVVTMTVGNLTALAQKNIKRMLAYSSIAHAGYLLVGLAVATPRGFAAMVYYLLAYAAMNLGAFAVVIWLNNRGTGDEVSDYAGLGRRAPVAALAMLVCFLSLIGIPPMAGFFGKFYLFAAAVEANMAWLAVVMVINSAISVGYYYGVVRQMYLVGDAAGAEDHGGAETGAPAPAEAASTVKGTPLVGLALGLAVVAVFALGFLFEPLARLARLAAGGL